MLKSEIQYSVITNRVAEWAYGIITTINQGVISR
jgi:hypothetical protein